MNMLKTIAALLGMPSSGADAKSPVAPSTVPATVTFVSRARQAGPSDLPPGSVPLPLDGDPMAVPIPHVALVAVAAPVTPIADPVTVLTLRQSLRSARLQQGVSIRGLAASAGMSVSSVVRAEAMDGTGVRTSLHVRLTEALKRIAARAAEEATVKPASSPKQGRARMRWNTPLPPVDTDEASTAQRALKGSILRELRQVRALTVTQVCSALNITQGHLRMLEAGEVERHLPYDRAIALVASAFPFGGKSR